MPYILADLVIDRVDLVDEGANSAAFIEVFKRKEQINPMEFSEILSKMKPEHSAVIQQEIDKVNDELTKSKTSLDEVTQQLTEANDALTKANTELETLKAKGDDTCECDGEADENGICKVCGKPKKKSAGFDETEVLKAMPEGAREAYVKMRDQKEAAEAKVREAAEKEAVAKATEKAAKLKSLPIEQAELVDILKSCDTKVASLLEAAASAIDTAVLGEVGKNAGNGAGTGNTDTWAKIEAKATEIAKRDSVTKQKAIAIAIKENPELYKEYIDGGAN